MAKIKQNEMQKFYEAKEKLREIIEKESNQILKQELREIAMYDPEYGVKNYHKIKAKFLQREFAKELEKALKNDE